jgi:GT2 family glycosyltransferase
MDLSVIIVSYNVRHFLEQCLLSVRKASEAIDCEVFVVDNNSADGSCSMVKSEFPGVKLIMNYVNRGFTAANNQALRIASGRYILILNPDTIVEEDTFRKCIAFMEAHPDAGATGVKMIDGKGRWLPESKRALPTPKTAFFKVFGLSFLFPKSRLFNRYYLGHLDDKETSKAEIISGAFMFLNREAMIKTGYLDEDYFMYGEDVDYSYRLLKAGFNNYYYPEIKIIHYKGESTKKEDLNVFIHFYKAMLIFVRKHFAEGSMKPFIFLIQAAIFFRAGLSLFRHVCRRLFLPVTDAVITYTVFRLITLLWEHFKFGGGSSYPPVFTNVIIPVYFIIIIISIALFSGYRLPSKTKDTVPGVISGTIIILIIYALLPLNLRFSRAVIIAGGLFSLISIYAWHQVVGLIFPGIADNSFREKRKSVVVSDSDGFLRIMELMKSSATRSVIAGRVSISPDDMKEEVLGNIAQLSEVIRINRIREVIYCTRNLNASQIIDSMHIISGQNISVRIASADEKYLLGSKYDNPEAGKLTDVEPSPGMKIARIIKGLFR